MYVGLVMLTSVRRFVVPGASRLGSFFAPVGSLVRALVRTRQLPFPCGAVAGAARGSNLAPAAYGQTQQRDSRTPAWLLSAAGGNTELA